MTYIEEPRAPHVTSANAERIAKRYLAYGLVIPLLAYLFAFVAVRVSPLKKVSVSQWDQVLDYNYSLAGQNADVVLFGDSSAFYGEDTVKLSRDLGLKVINIPSNMGALPILQDRMLRLYLSENRPPKLIVFHFSVWGMAFKQTPNALMYDGVEQVMRHGSLRDFSELLRKYPIDVFMFPFRFYQTPSQLTTPVLWKVLPRPVVEQGHTAFPGHVQLKSPCSITKAMWTATNTQSVQELVRDFTSPVTKTLVYLPPLPDCEHASDVANRSYPGIVADRAEILPSQVFADDTFYAHVMAVSADQYTDLLEGKIRKALGQSGQR